MCWVQDLMGIGHQQRAAAISRAMCELGLDVMYVSGGEPVPNLDLGCAHLVQLPPARSLDTRYTTLVDEQGLPVDERWRSARRSALLACFTGYRPDVVLTETFPFGRRLLHFELFPLLDTAWGRCPRPRVISSVRDMVERRTRPERNAQIVDLVARYFDLVLVHGDPELVPFEASFPLAHRIREKLRYTGYVLQRVDASPGSEAGSGEVVVSAGGGIVGENLIRTAMEARALSNLAHATWRILAGPKLPVANLAQMQADAPAGVIIERNRRDFRTLLRNCAVSISQAGYNTILEVLNARTRAVVVPYTDNGQREQAARARLLAQRSAMELVEHHELSAARLAIAVDAAHSSLTPPLPEIDTNGAMTSARIVASAIARGAAPIV